MKRGQDSEARWRLRIEHTWDGEPVGDDEAVNVEMTRGATELCLRIDAPFHDDPPPDSPDLWRYEVVELMVAGAGDAYLELELSPHGRHLVLFLHGERHVVRRGDPLDYRAFISSGRWTGQALVPISWLPGDATRLNAFAIHGVGTARRYLAWKPTGGVRPDFHRLAAFGTFDECLVVE